VDRYGELACGSSVGRGRWRGSRYWVSFGVNMVAEVQEVALSADDADHSEIHGPWDVARPRFKQGDTI
jgi:hypothetical protein